MNLKTLMLGWEFPPFISGGLGTACYGLTKAMDHLGMQVTFVLPRAKPIRFAGGKALAHLRQQPRLSTAKIVDFGPKTRNSAGRPTKCSAIK